MGFDTSGFVLKSARSAPSNATTTAGASSGVLREHANLPGSYALPGNLVEVSADQYRAAVLSNPDAATQEYLFWAANSSNIAMLEDPSWSITQGVGTIPSGTRTVTAGFTTYTDGTDRIVVTDNDNRSIAGITEVTVKRGDAPLSPIVFTGSDYTVDADAGLVVFDAGALVTLDGGLSLTRGDTISAVTYYLAAQKFWWTRNDASLTRFGWDGTTQKWTPLKGSPPVALGKVLADASYALIPHPDRFAVGDYLPYNPASADAFSMVRIGSRPDATSAQTKVLVVSDDDAASTYSFPVGVDAVVGVSSGVLQWNPLTVTANAGRDAWYVPETYAENVTGVLGSLKGADAEPLFITPIPGLTDYPLIRFGSRRYLVSRVADTDAALAALSINEGEVGWSLTTGKLKFSAADVAKADPDDAGFELLYLGAQVVCDGVSLTSVPVGTRTPVQVVDSAGAPTTVTATRTLFIPASKPLPAPGTSGVMLVPDGTGVVPNTSATPGTRPNGSGLVRELGVDGDTILFGKAGAVESLSIVEFETELPKFAFQIAKGQGYAARELSGTGAGSRIEIGRQDRKLLDGEPLYFVQAVVQPAAYTNVARLVSRVREPFVLDGTEVLALSIDGTNHLWSAAGLGAGTYSAADIALDIDALLIGPGTARAVNGRVVLSAQTVSTGRVEIGFGSTSSGAFADRNLSGCAALGFMPAWRAVGGQSNWLPDAGLALEVARSPLNLNRTQPTSDFQAQGRFTNAVLSRSVIASPVFPLNNPPLLDVAGYDEGIFFQTIDGMYRRSLAPFEDVLYTFDEGRFAWLEVNQTTMGVSAATTSLALGATGVVGDTMHPAVHAGNGLYLDTVGAPFVLQTLGTDYLLDEAPGVATLIDRIGAQVASGSLGSFTAGDTTFTDVDATFVASGVAAGYRLKLVGGDPAVQGSYIVASVTNGTTLEVEGAVPFPKAGTVVSWEIYEGQPASGYDPGLLADVVYEPFNHLPDEPFQVRVLSSLGATPADATAQALSRLNAVVSAALASGRVISVRFGQDYGSDEASVVALSRSRLGVMANGTLSVPNITDSHFTTPTPTFSILVGAQVYADGAGLVGVTSFSSPLLGDQVEYGLPASGIAGQLKFGEDTLANLSESYVYYVQTFTDPTDLVQGEAEVDPTSGDLNLSASDMANHAGETAFFVEQMVTEDRKDVAISPMQGALAFKRPLRAFQLVEASYYQADSSGNLVVDSTGTPTRITEFLPLFVRMESATKNTASEYAFNPTGRTVRSDIPTQVWVDNRLQNYGNTTTATVDAADSVIRFASPVTASSVVLNYAVNETFGGEQGFTVSTTPVWRPPFFLLADENVFALNTDRTSDLVPGKLLRVGASPFYVEASTYDVITDTTAVTIFPTPDTEAGSRAPGNDVLTLLSSVPVTTDVNGVPTTGDAGFLLTLGADYEPVDPGMLSMVFHGNVTAFVKAGHLLEVGGYPFLSAGAVLSADGLTTTVYLTSPLMRGFTSTTDAVRVSARPIYPPEARRLVGLGPVVPTEPTELVLFGELSPTGNPLPGRTLVLDRDYDLDASTGAVSLLAPIQDALQPGQKLFLAYTQLRAMAPMLVNGMIVVPRYHAQYAHVTTPTESNGFLSAYLVGTYSYRSPDTFYVRTVSMPDWMGEVAQVAADRVAARTPHGGPVVVSGPPTDNWQYGTVPVESGARELLDQDRAARVFISLYDSYIQTFEQVNETILGDVVGDRDGKFRFFVGRGKVYGGPGYEDSISGELESRFVWSQVFEAANQSYGVVKADPLVDPATSVQDPVTLKVSGPAMNPWLLDFYIRSQREFVLNDMDDTILADKSRAQISFPFLFEVPGSFKRMWAPSVISRLYPESTLAFTTTYPGLGAGTLPTSPGVYSFLKLIDRPGLLAGSGPAFGSTFGMDIGDVSNPALGLIQNITGQVKPRPRLARARIWAYSPTGFPELGGPSKPSVIATPLLLRDFPLDPTTGLPDLARLAEQGGDLPDLSTGDYELSTPVWEGYDAAAQVFPQVAFGRPTGDTYSVGYASDTILDAIGGAFPFTTPVFKGIYVANRYFGCILTFTDDSGVEISDPQDIIRIAADGVTTLPFDPAYGDTIYVIPPSSSDTSGFSNPPSAEDLAQFAAQAPSLDVGVRERRSSFVDWSLPSYKDPSPFPIKEMVGQRSASPLQPIEANVEFANTSRDPLEFPALLGRTTNDYGDYSLPYLSTPNTEILRLGAVQPALVAIEQTDGPFVSHTWLAVYPNEIVGDDGTILASASGATPPATLITGENLLPVSTATSYTPHSGIGDVRPFDLLLVEKAQVGIVNGAEGILSVGAVSTNTVEPPRFVTATAPATTIRYLFTNAMAHTSGLGGMEVSENGGLITIFDISSVSGLVLNDGSGVGTGGLNNIVDNALFAYPNNNLITIQILDHATGAVLETITLQGDIVTGGLGSQALPVQPMFSDKLFEVPAIGFVDFAALGGASPGPVGPFDFLISVRTTGVGAGSATGYVDGDRLTFVEEMDLSTTLPRGSVLGATSTQAELSVNTVTASGTTSCTVNHPAVVNGGSAFTFLARDAGAPNTIGTFSSGTGTIKVMGFEGHGNTPIPSTSAFTFAATPSSDQDEAGIILEGLGVVYDTGVAGINPNSVVEVNVFGGSPLNVESGDILVIEASATGDGTTKAGTYIVRHAVDDTSTSGYDEVFAVAFAGTTTGWVKSELPSLVSAASGILTVSSVQTVGTSPTGHDWAATGRVYLFVSAGDLTQTLSREYTTIVVNGDGTATFTLDTTNTTGLTATGAYLSDAQFDTAAAANLGQFLSGMAYLPIGRISPSYPDNNVVGFGTGLTTAGGFVDVTYQNGVASVTFAYGADLVIGSPAVDSLGVVVSDATNTDTSVGFIADRATPVYLDVPLYVDMTGLTDPTSTVYATLHPTATAVRCVAPADVFRAHDGASTVNTGFRAQAGVFLEPSMPRAARDLGDGELKVVDAGNTVLGTDRIGMRPAATFLVPSPEAVAFQVRRIRRFHEILDAIGTNIGPLRYAYEIRTGTVSAYSGYTLTATGTGTQLGAFTSTDVNINAGDTVRLLDINGTVVDTAEVASVTGAATLLLRAPGFAVAPPLGGETFQVYLRQAPVPHEQSNAQLLDLITDQVILTRVADPVGDEGGRSDVVNEFRDNGIVDFAALSPAPQVGDIVLVDPAGSLAGPSGLPSPAEYGSRPFGDQSVSTRGDGSYVAGGPGDLDDNRGWYRITVDPQVTQSYLTVSGVTDFSGADGSPVLFGDDSPTNQQFTVYPDIHASVLTGATEGQMDFRPTKTANPTTNSYLDGTYKSIEPVSYRILRPTKIVSEETVDLVLFLRERMLSWQEEIAVAMRGDKQGSYYVFQRDEHIADLGSPTNSDDGLGVPSNAYLESLSGLTQYAPFANTNDCLSVLDRRFWCLDTRMDREYPPWSGGTDPYSSFEADYSTSGYTVGSGRPVEPDRVTEVLDQSDKLRALRYSWIKFRANQMNGTLPSIDRFYQELPRLLQEQADYLRLRQSIQDAE